MKASHLAVLVLLAVVSAACSDRTSSTASGEAGAGGSTEPETPDAVGPVLPAFLDEGPVALKVDGVPVPKATIERYLKIWKIRRPQTSDETLTRDLIELGIVPTAAMYAEHAEADAAELSRRAWKAHGRLERGEQWEVVLAEMSDDPNKELNRTGSLGIRRRLAVPGLPSPSPEIEQRAFELSLKQHSKPFCTEKGVQMVRPMNEVRLPGQSDAEAQRDIQHLLFAWGKEYRAHLAQWSPDKSEEEAEAFKRKLKQLQEKMKRRIRAARIEILDESYRTLIYPFRLKK